MKSYNLIVLLSLSALFASISAQESPKNSTVVEKQVNAGIILLESLSEFYKNSYIGIIHGGFVAKKDIFVYFKERINHRNALILNISDATDYQTLTTDIIAGFDAVIASYTTAIEIFKIKYSSSMKNTYEDMMLSFMGQTIFIRDIIDTNTTAYDCYMNYFRNMITKEFNDVTIAVPIKTYRSSMASKVIANSEFMKNVQMLIVSFEKKLVFCSRSLSPVKCLNNYAKFTGQSLLKIVQDYQGGTEMEVTSTFLEAQEVSRIQHESMAEVLANVVVFTKFCAKIINSNSSTNVSVGGSNIAADGEALKDIDERAQRVKTTGRKPCQGGNQLLTPYVPKWDTETIIIIVFNKD
ncbi:unnamed protein product [Diamesa tonsa]